MELSVLFEGTGVRETIVTPAPRGLEALDFARRSDPTLLLDDLNCKSTIIESAKIYLTEEQARSSRQFFDKNVHTVKIKDISKLGAMYRKWEYDPESKILSAKIDPRKIYDCWQRLGFPSLMRVSLGSLQQSLNQEEI